MAVGRISGPLLKANLVRSTLPAERRNLAFETDLLYIDVNNDRIGVKTTSPQYPLDVAGTIRTTDLQVSTSTQINNVTISANSITTTGNQLDLATPDSAVYNNRLIVDDLIIDGNTITATDTNQNFEIIPSGTGTVEVRGDTRVEGNIHATGNIRADGNIQIGDQDTDTITINADVASNLVPDASNTYTLGLANKRWDEVFANNLTVDNLTLTGNITVNGLDLTARPGKTYYVATNGDDLQTGTHQNDPYASLTKALSVATSGDHIHIYPGTYTEVFPLVVPVGVSVRGDGLRAVTIQPTTPTKTNDGFILNGEVTIEDLTITGFNFDSVNNTGHAFRFNSNGDSSGYAVTSRSPYIRNCTNFMTGSIGMRINGDHANAAFTGINSLGQDLKSMVCDSFTQYNEAGIGVSITNDGYAQLVSIFTIGCEKGIYVDSGGQCDLTNSNSSFGIFGLVADGVGDTQFTGTVNTATVAEGDTFTLNNVKDDLNNVRKPFDGQAFFFKLDLDDYADTALGKTGITTAPLNLVRSIKITDGGSGYSQSAPPNVTITAPAGPEAILAELSANVSAAGTITSVDVIASGRNFLPTGVGANQQDVTISFSSGSATAVAEMDPIFFTVETATEPTNAGLTTVTFNEFVPYAVSAGSSSEFKRISRIITSSHSFEYIGAGTDINSSNPFQGGEPIPENEIVAINGGQVPFTSTDQKGNFRIGQGLTVDQTTSTIRGRDFNRAIQAQLTPLILALR